jgi:hypothetical protein
MGRSDLSTASRISTVLQTLSVSRSNANLRVGKNPLRPRAGAWCARETLRRASVRCRGNTPALAGWSLRRQAIRSCQGIIHSRSRPECYSSGMSDETIDVLKDRLEELAILFAHEAEYPQLGENFWNDRHEEEKQLRDELEALLNAPAPHVQPRGFRVVDRYSHRLLGPKPPRCSARG